MCVVTLVGQEHLGERGHPDHEVENSAAVGVVGAVVVGLHWRHGVIVTGTLLILLLQVLRTHTRTHTYNHGILMLSKWVTEIQQQPSTFLDKGDQMQRDQMWDE